MFIKKWPALRHAKSVALVNIPNNVQKEISARYANLFMICYQNRDISGIHITFTAFTHTLHALQLWEQKKAFMLEMRDYIMQQQFPLEEIKALDWLLHHYFEQVNEVEESALLNWYQSLDDEWILRKKLKTLFPDKTNSELTLLIAIEQQKLSES